MLHTPPEYREPWEREFEISDITVGLGLRLHEGNPWLLDHLKLQMEHYRPRPRMVLVDQGSDPAPADAVRRLADETGAKYIRDDYRGLYSPGRARNLAASAAETDFIFLTDPDCLAVSDLFRRLTGLINNTGLAAQPDLMLNLPVYHLSRRAASDLRAAGDPAARSAALESFRMKTIFGDSAWTEFVAPYSNVFLCRKDGFSLVGGYDESFAGHGSEDFEFLLRHALVMGRYPIPAWPASDMHRPADESFFHQHQYEGFRALLSAMSFPAESSGLAAFHLNHPVDADSDWMTKGDRQRNIFRARVMPYLEDKRALIERDWLPRPRRLLALTGDEAQSSLWLAFRLAGYRLRMAAEDSLRPESVDWEGLDAVAAFKDDIRRRPAFDAVRREAENRGVEFITVEKSLAADSRISRSHRGPPGGKDGPPPEASAGKTAEQPSPAETAEHQRGSDETRSTLQQYSLEHQGVIYRFRLSGRRVRAYDRFSYPPMIGPRSYMPARLGLLPKKQWRLFSETGRVSNEKPFFNGSPAVRHAALIAERFVLQRLLTRQPKKLDKYMHNRIRFFMDSRHEFLIFYHKLWRRLFGE